MNINDSYAEVLCQNCRKNKVLIKKNAPYFGIMCGDCSQRPFRYASMEKK